MNKVIIEKIVIHKFDMEHSKIIASDKLISLVEGTLDYYDSKIEKTITSSTKKEVLVGNHHQIFQYANKMIESDDTFKANATAISNDLFNLCRQIEEMPDSNVIYIECKIEGKKHILVLKLNYKSTPICLIEEKDGMTDMSFVNRQMPPAKSTNVDEAFIINIEDNKLFMIEKRVVIDGKPGYYLNDQYIKGETKLSDKEKINIVTKAVRKVDSEYNVVDGDPIPLVKKELANLVLDHQPVKPIALAKKVLESDYNATVEVENILHEIGIIENDEIENVPGNVDKISRCKLVLDGDRTLELDVDDYINSRNISKDTDMIGNTTITISNIRDIVIK